MVSLQKESEWDENIKEVADELWELLPPNFFYKNINRKTMYNWIRTRLENILYNREKEIAEEVKKLYSLDYMKGSPASYINRALDKVLQILKH